MERIVYGNMRWKDIIQNFNSSNASINVKFESNDRNFIGIKIIQNPNIIVIEYKVSDDKMITVYSNGYWYDKKYKNINFGNSKKNLTEDEDIYNWFVKFATWGLPSVYGIIKWKNIIKLEPEERGIIGVLFDFENNNQSYKEIIITIDSSIYIQYKTINDKIETVYSNGYWYEGETYKIIKIDNKQQILIDDKISTITDDGLIYDWITKNFTYGNPQNITIKDENGRALYPKTIAANIIDFDYNKLENKPQIDGVLLTSETQTKDLKIIRTVEDEDTPDDMSEGQYIFKLIDNKEE